MSDPGRWLLVDSFIKVVDAGSFTIAAERLGISRSHLSKRISQLEQSLGIQLLVRTTRHLRTTQEGAALYARCSPLFHELEEAVESTVADKTHLKGTLRVVCPDIIGEVYVARAAVEVGRIYPELQVDVVVTMEDIDLVADNFDLAVRFGELNDSSLRARQVFELPHLVCASPSYLAQNGIPQKIDDLVAHNCLRAGFEPCVTWHFSVKGQDVSLLPKGTWTSNSGSALMNAALDGVGLCRLPEIYLRPHIKSGRLVPVLEEFCSAPLPVWMVYPNSRFTPPKVRMFIDYFANNIERLILERSQ